MVAFTAIQSIDAPAKRVWSVMSDVERWPEWTPTIARVERLDPGPLDTGPLDTGPLGVGSRVRILQPKLRPAVWTVTEWRAGRSFSWESRELGVHAVAEHAVIPAAKGCSVCLVVRFEGWLGGLVGRIYGRLTQCYMELEAEGLRARCELASPVDPHASQA